ncbi:MAG: PPA1309 family protein [Actinomycetota bacterium]|nr:PPA1309 family protein [Actinomycetota bacterium]MDH4352928.1 PPA1309 family protein [Actinomycetota bacterium]
MDALPPPPGGALAAAVRDLERHVAAAGWDQPIRLFALVRTADLLAREPGLAGTVPSPTDPDELSSLEQEQLPEHDGPADLLARVAWPETVDGVALTVERYVVSRGEREEVRITAAALRDGSRWSAVRVRAHDHDLEVLDGPDLVPELAEAVLACLAD